MHVQGHALLNPRTRLLMQRRFLDALSTRRSTRSSSATAWALAQSAIRWSTGKCSTKSATERSSRCPAPHQSACPQRAPSAADDAPTPPPNSCQKAATTRIYEKQKSRKRCACAARTCRLIAGLRFYMWGAEAALSHPSAQVWREMSFADNPLYLAVLLPLPPPTTPLHSLSLSLSLSHTHTHTHTYLLSPAL